MRMQETGKNTIWLLVLSILAVFALGAVASSQGAHNEAGWEKDILSTNPRDRDQAVERLLQERRETINRLIELVNPANANRYSNETRSAAAYVLGEMRAAEAVPALAEALAKEPVDVKFGSLGRFEMPFLTALVKIGRPAAPAMIHNIETTDQEMLRIRSLDALDRILGGKKRLLELLNTLSARTAGNLEKQRRIALAVARTREHYKEDEEPLY